MSKIEKLTKEMMEQLRVIESDVCGIVNKHGLGPGNTITSGTRAGFISVSRNGLVLIRGIDDGAGSDWEYTIIVDNGRPYGIASISIDPTNGFTTWSAGNHLPSAFAYFKANGVLMEGGRQGQVDEYSAALVLVDRLVRAFTNYQP